MMIKLWLEGKYEGCDAACGPRVRLPWADVVSRSTTVLIRFFEIMSLRCPMSAKRPGFEPQSTALVRFLHPKSRKCQWSTQRPSHWVPETVN
jgi:hypothetical protein